MNWLSVSSQSPAIELEETHITTLTLQYCTNLLVAGVIKQIPDKYAPTQDTFKVSFVRNEAEPNEVENGNIQLSNIRNY